MTLGRVFINSYTKSINQKHHFLTDIYYYNSIYDNNSLWSAALTSPANPQLQPLLPNSHSQVKVKDSGGGVAEGGMRLTCHLLLRLFKTAEGPQPGLYSVGSPPLTAPPLGVRLSCDRHLLAAAHRNIHVGPVLAVLKAVLLVGDATAKEGAELSISHILGTSDLLSGGDGPSLDLA